MRLLILRVSALILVAGIVGCGGGIEAGAPKGPQEVSPDQKQALQALGKSMMKGAKAYQPGKVARK